MIATYTNIPLVIMNADSNTSFTTVETNSPRELYILNLTRPFSFVTKDIFVDGLKGFGLF